jgi:hypothetical protein
LEIVLLDPTDPSICQKFCLRKSGEKG